MHDIITKDVQRNRPTVKLGLLCLLCIAAFLLGSSCSGGSSGLTAADGQQNTETGESPAGDPSSGGEFGNAPPPELPPPSFDATVEREVTIEMDDGVRLAGTVTFPSNDGNEPAPGPFPVVVSMTPYSRNGTCACPDRTVFARRGIIGATVDVRGTGGSEGNLDENYFSPLEASDSAAVIEYFGTRDYSTGRVGMAGGSYVGITQLLAAELRPPHLSVIVPQVPLSDLYRDGYTHGGIVNLFFDAQYIAVQGVPGLAGGNNDPALGEMTVMAKIQQLTGTPIYFDYLERPNDAPFYRDRSPIYDADQIEVPVLLIGGWRDGLSQRGNPELFHVLSQRHSVETRMYMDPCTHKGCGPPFAPLNNPQGQDDLPAIIFEYLSKHLLDADVPERPPVRVYVQGANEYLNDIQWPPQGTQFKRLYLNQGGLTEQPPTQASVAEYFTNPTAGLSMTFDYYGTVGATPFIPTDQRLESGNGLTWRSESLPEPLRLTGPSVLHLVASSSASDTDWIVKMTDVAPDGSETIISNGYLRASHRELNPERSREGVPYHTHTDPTPIEPGRKFVYEIEVWPTAYELPAGHRLQIRLTSFDVPTHAPASAAFDRNNPLATQITPLLPAMNAVTEGGSDPSFLLIPEYTQ